MFTIFAEYIFDCSVISYNFLYFGIRHFELKNLINRGNRNIKFDWCIEECSKGEMNVPIMKFREKGTFL